MILFCIRFYLFYGCKGRCSENTRPGDFFPKEIAARLLTCDEAPVLAVMGEMTSPASCRAWPARETYPALSAVLEKL